MAKQTRVVVIDDLDGTELSEADASTVRFQWYGIDYEIDLSDQHAAEFHEAIDPYLAKAHQPAPVMVSVGPVARRRRSSTGPVENIGREKSRAVRAWAYEQGIEVAQRGRVPSDVVARFDAAHGGA